MFDSLKELKSSRSASGNIFFKFRDAGREGCCCSEQDHPEFPIQEEGQSRRTESLDRGSVPARKTDCLHDLRLFSSDWRSLYSINAGLFSVTLHDDNIQEFDTRWDEVLLSMSKLPSDDILESSLYKLRIRESAQLKNRIGIVRYGESSEDIDAQLSDIENDGERSTDQKL